VRAELEQQTQGREQAIRAEIEQQAKAREQALRGDLEREAQAREQTLRTELQQQVQAVDQAVRAELVEQARAREQALRRELEQQAEAREQEVRRELEEQIGAREDSLRGEIDQAVAAARRGAELERESDRRRAQNELDAERTRAQQALEAERARAAELDATRARVEADAEALAQRLHGEIAAARASAAAAPRSAASAPSGMNASAFERASAGIRELDGTRTLTQALDTLIAHAAPIAGRAALFLIEGDRLKAWKAAGIADTDVRAVDASIGGRDLLSRATQTGSPVRTSAELPPPPFARLGPNGTGAALPIMIGGRAVAVLYADGGAEPLSGGAFETLEVLARHASTVVALRTAMRTLDVLRGVSPDAPGGDSLADDQGARRFARLLISEIKLYNEAAVRTGRQQKDLRQRLRAEIDRAQRLYEERVPPALGARHVVFQQELVQTLADGDPALLGNA
jgi:hypothetical protein